MVTGRWTDKDTAQAAHPPGHPRWEGVDAQRARQPLTDRQVGLSGQLMHL